MFVKQKVATARKSVFVENVNVLPEDPVQMFATSAPSQDTDNKVSCSITITTLGNSVAGYAILAMLF